MRFPIDPSPWRMRRLRRLATWLALLALGFHMLVMAMHDPAVAAVAPEAHAAAPCDGHAHDGAPDSHKAPDRGHRGAYCPICQSLQVPTYLPQAAAIADAPIVPAGGPVAETASLPPPLRLLSATSARGPPGSA